MKRFVLFLFSFLLLAGCTAPVEFGGINDWPGETVSDGE